MLSFTTDAKKNIYRNNELPRERANKYLQVTYKRAAISTINWQLKNIYDH